MTIEEQWLQLDMNMFFAIVKWPRQQIFAFSFAYDWITMMRLVALNPRILNKDQIESIDFRDKFKATLSLKLKQD